MKISNANCKLVIDTNLIIGGYWNRKSDSWRIVEGCMSGKWQHYYTNRIKEEVFRILGNIHARSSFVDIIECLYDKGTKVNVVQHFRTVKDDPDDNKYLDCAFVLSASFIVSNDNHLLRIKSFLGTEIIKPVEFARRQGT